MNLRTFRVTLYSVILLFIGYSCQHEIDLDGKLDNDLLTQIERVSPTGSSDYYILPDPDDFSSIPQDPKNPITGPKRALGMYLFHETGIALKAAKPEGLGTYSCASCHNAPSGFKPGRFQGVADGAVGFGMQGEERELSDPYLPEEVDAQSIRPLSVLNSAFVSNTFWNGQFGSSGVNEGTEHLWDDLEETEVNHFGFEGIESQNIEGFEVHRLHVDEEVVDELGYRSLFDLAFPEYNSQERYTNLTASLAVSAYIRTLISDQAPFQNYLKGDANAITEEEKNGALLFFGKAGCYRCHSGPSFSSVEFHAVGVNDLHELGGLRTSADDRRNLGRGGFTGNQEDMFAFKVPHLYNLAGTPFYFHGSSKQSIREVVEYFNEGIPENDNVPQENISPLFTPLFLTEQEVDELTAFLEKSLEDPYLERHVPPYVFSGNCFPNNDPQSQVDLGCE